MIYIKQGDDGYGIEDELTYEDAPLDLTDATVHFHMGGHSIRSQVVDAANGKILTILNSVHTAIPKLYRGEYVVKFDGREETYPNNGYIHVMILGGVNDGIL